MKTLLYAVALLSATAGVAMASAKVYLQETFDGAWESRWVNSKTKSDLGKFEVSKGKFYADDDIAPGLRTSQDAHFYAISRKLDSEFSNRGKDLVLQFTVKHEQNIDCGGGYIKILPTTLKPEEFNGDSEYYLMFGPDICGATKKVHVIINYKGKNYLIKKHVSAQSDDLTHLYTLVLKPDQTYSVLIDNKEEATGKLTEDWDVLPPKTIKDPNAKKPEGWVDEAEIEDPSDIKPAEWDDVPEFVADPDAQKPEDWDDEMDGEWEAPKIKNSEFRGKWKPKKMPNPAYKGPWIHPEIENPDYYEDNEIYAFDKIGYAGFDLWQVKSGTIFDNILLTDDTHYAKDFGDQTWGKIKEVERKKRDEMVEAERKADDQEPEKMEPDTNSEDAEHDEL